MSKQHIIIGSSAAGMGVVSKLRVLDPESTILCISASPELPYNTCLLADYLAGSKESAEVYTKPQHFFDQNAIGLRLNTKVVEVDSKNQRIYLDTGESLAYDTLFLGMGTRSHIPAIEGRECYDGIFNFHTLTDVEKIFAYLRKHDVKKVCVIGGGLSGVECADALALQGKEVILFERSTRILSQHVDDNGALFIERRMKQAGVNVYTNAVVQEIQGVQGRVSGVKTMDGQVIPIDMVICATGAHPNSALIHSAGGELFEGRIITNSYLATSLTNIYAGGDIAAVRHYVTKDLVASTTWPDATKQGMIAAHAMAGIPKEYDGVLPLTSSHFFGCTFVSCGPVLNAYDDQSVVIRHNKEGYLKLVGHDDVITGFLMVGAVDDVGFLCRQVMTRASLNAIKIFLLNKI